MSQALLDQLVRIADANGSCDARPRGGHARSGPQLFRFRFVTVMVFSCSLSPVVVLVSRLFCGRRFERSEGAAHGATDDARATRAARAYTTGGSRRRSRAGAFARCVRLLLFLFSLCLSLRACRSLASPAPSGGALTTSVRPVRRPARAALLLRAPAPAGRARTTRGRADAHRARRARSTGVESARRALSVSPRPRSRAALRWGLGVVSLSSRPSPRARRSVTPRLRAGG